jgi:hypothetical protein
VASATENAAVVKGPVEHLMAHGLKQDRRGLFVIMGLSAAIVRVSQEHAEVQHWQLHKRGTSPERHPGGPRSESPQRLRRDGLCGSQN